MKKVYFFLTFLCFSITAFAQQTTITGKVVDASNNEALPDVEVTIENSAFTVTTDAEGNFNFDTFDVPLGEQIISLEKNGKGKLSINIIGSKFGLLKSKTNLSAVHFKKSSNATTIGTSTETTAVRVLYKLIRFIFYSLNNFKRSSLRIVISSDSPLTSNFSLKSTDPL